MSLVAPTIPWRLIGRILGEVGNKMSIGRGVQQYLHPERKRAVVILAPNSGHICASTFNSFSSEPQR